MRGHELGVWEEEEEEEKKEEEEEGRKRRSSSVCVQYNTQKRKSSEKWVGPGTLMT